MSATKKKYKHIRILIVENDTIYRTIAEALLKDYFSIKSVSNGSQALLALETKKYDIVLLDTYLGDSQADGTEIMKRIRANPKHEGIKIIAVTADYDEQEHIVREGFDGLYTKPVVKEDILEVLTKMYLEKQE